MHVAAWERVLGVDVRCQDLGEESEVFGVEGEAVEGEDVLDGDVVDWVGHFGLIDGGGVGALMSDVGEFRLGSLLVLSWMALFLLRDDQI